MTSLVSARKNVHIAYAEGLVIFGPLRGLHFKLDAAVSAPNAPCERFR